MPRRKLRIVVATHHLITTGGSENYAYALIRELRNAGHELYYYTLYEGAVSERIERELGVTAYDRSTRVDLILASHYTAIYRLCGRGFILQTCHGKLHELEQPSLFANAYVAVSAEVQEHLTSKRCASEVILNGIDCDRFHPMGPVRTRPERILSLCQGEEANERIRQACERIGASFHSRSKLLENRWDIERSINDADLVFGVGRSAYDAMACGRPVIVFDSRSYMGVKGDGYAAPILEESIKYNCSGRRFGRDLSVDDLVVEIGKYDPSDSQRLRDFALRELNIDTQATRYLQIYRSFTETRPDWQLFFRNGVLPRTRKFCFRRPRLGKRPQPYHGAPSV